jgi:hypothetical protein
LKNPRFQVRDGKTNRTSLQSVKKTVENANASEQCPALEMVVHGWTVQLLKKHSCWT